VAAGEAAAALQTLRAFYDARGGMLEPFDF
jgi:hypothetical protein